MPIVTRFPPSPTGHLHLGGARTALFNWLYARKTGGEMVLRIEDTDTERSSTAAVDTILETMKWLGLTWDHGPYFQTQRFDRYAEVIHQLLAQDDAYYCTCSRARLDALRQEQRAAGEKPRYDGHCRDLARPPSKQSVVRFRNPSQGIVGFDDMVRGTIEMDNGQLDDLVLARSDGTPTYNFTVVVDDIDMKITHVLRGDDHINNTPRQINIFTALAAQPPRFAHMPLILGADGQRLSKRHGAVSVLEYRAMGILPEALLNYLLRLGWSHGDQEIFGLDEMIELFTIEAINRAPATFNLDKLLWLNQHYIATIDPARLETIIAKRLNQNGIGLSDGPKISEVVTLMRSRAQTLQQLEQNIAYFYQAFDQYDSTAVAQHIQPNSVRVLAMVRQQLAQLPHWQQEPIKQLFQEIVKLENLKFPQLAQPLRIALTGTANAPAIDAIVALMGRDKSLARLDKAVTVFSE